MDQIMQLGTILAIWAHPDDETFCAGGLLAMAAANGQKIVNVTATRGELGAYDETRWPSSQLAAIRTAESDAAFAILGLKDEHIWLDLPDGGCQNVDHEKVTDQIRDIVARERPDSIITFGPDGLTGHPDHCSVSSWAKVAADKIPMYCVVQDTEQYEQQLRQMDQQFNIYFNTDKPPLKPASDCDIALHLPPEILAKKLDALRAMPSQYDAMFQGLSPDQLSHMFDLECFVRAKG